jgi:hypothetical protein
VTKAGNIRKAIQGKEVGTLVEVEKKGER